MEDTQWIIMEMSGMGSMGAALFQMHLRYPATVTIKNFARLLRKPDFSNNTRSERQNTLAESAALHRMCSRPESYVI